MAWGEIEQWLDSLSGSAFDIAVRHIDRLADEGPLLGEPYTRQLRGKLRELRFVLERQDVRITYFIATGRRIVLLTVFAKRGRREVAGIDRAEQEMARCLAAGHSAEEDDP